MFYFTHFTGSKKSLLYRFFLASYKVPLGYYDGLSISDKLPVNILFGGPLLWLHDFIAPFHMFLRPAFNLEFEGSTNELEPLQINITTHANRMIYGRKLPGLDFRMEINDDGVSRFVVVSKKEKKEYIRCV